MFKFPIHIDKDSLCNIKKQSDLAQFLKEMSLAMSYEDLLHIQKYFISEDRNPTETEIRMLDTYWSDHCRHTTFETLLTNITFSSDSFNKQIENTFNDYLNNKVNAHH